MQLPGAVLPEGADEGILLRGLEAALGASAEAYEPMRALAAQGAARMEADAAKWKRSLARSRPRAAVAGDGEEEDEYE